MTEGDPSRDIATFVIGPTMTNPIDHLRYGAVQIQNVPSRHDTGYAAHLRTPIRVWGAALNSHANCDPIVRSAAAADARLPVGIVLSQTAREDLGVRVVIKPIFLAVRHRE